MSDGCVFWLVASWLVWGLLWSHLSIGHSGLGSFKVAKLTAEVLLQPLLKSQWPVGHVAKALGKRWRDSTS